MIFLERTRESHRQSDKHWNCFIGDIVETSERLGRVHMGISEHTHTILNWTEQNKEFPSIAVSELQLTQRDRKTNIGWCFIWCSQIFVTWSIIIIYTFIYIDIYIYLSQTYVQRGTNQKSSNSLHVFHCFQKLYQQTQNTVWDLFVFLSSWSSSRF